MDVCNHGTVTEAQASSICPERLQMEGVKRARRPGDLETWRPGDRLNPNSSLSGLALPGGEQKHLRGTLRTAAEGGGGAPPLHPLQILVFSCFQDGREEANDNVRFLKALEAHVDALLSETQDFEARS